LKAKADRNAVVSNDATALHAAIINGHQETVRLLLDFRINVDAVPGDERTPLILAANNGHIETVNLLQGNEVEGKRNNPFLACCDQY